MELSRGSFQIQLLRTFGSANDVEGIHDVLDDLQSSPTQITFLGLSSLETADFLNIAGKRGMHETHLWLSPKAVAAAKNLDPPSTGGIWGISYGEELTEDDPFAKRYLAKDPSPDELSYWGTYAYDAVLVAAHGLAAANNQSNGEEVLKEIRSLSIDNAATGVIEIDENGDRIGARIPVFYISSEGTAEQFSVYYNNTLEFVKDPLWPGGLTEQPILIKEEVDSSR